MRAQERLKKAAPIGDGIDSSWTETPADKQKKREARARKAAMGVNEKPKSSRNAPAEVTNRDKDLAAQVAMYNSRARPVSLMEMHVHKRKTSDPEEKAVRRPFDPSRDLDVTKSDPTKKADMIKSSIGFNAKFAHGKKHFV